MNILRWSIVMIASILSCYSMIASAQVSDGDLVLRDFHVVREGDSLSFALHAPAVLQQAMWAEGITPHPFIGNNEDSIQWISDHNWLLHTSFELTEEALSSARAYLLCLSAVDTYSEIYLNGVAVGETENLFRDYTFDVKDQLHPGTNRLVVRLLSPTRKAHALYLSTGFNYPADNDRHDIHYAPLVRKSQYHFGWDWGPRIVTMGLGAPVVLHKVESPELRSSYVHSQITWDEHHPHRPRAKSAVVTIESEVMYADPSTELTITLLSPEGTVIGSQRKKLNTERDTTTFDVAAPALWMPNGRGSQPLYTIVRELSGSHHKDSQPFGIREIYLDTTRDSIGQAFTFVVNHEPLYIKGANYLPHDRRFGGGGQSLRQLFEEDIVPAHFNMLRVWGGGDYESEEFYELADRHGILIWQDFPFACSTYPNDTAFRANVSMEVRDRLSHIRNHPSIALLCGNNEVLEGMEHWGWQKKYGYSQEVWAKMHWDYDSFFRGLLADKVREYAPHISYIHGSPLSSNWGIAESLGSGDSHYWGVWFGGEDFDTFEAHHGRFASEYGFQAFPEMKTIRSFAPSAATDTLTIHSPLLTKRQRSFIGNERIAEYMQRTYPVPSEFEDFVYVGQVLQGRGMGQAIRAIRRGYPVNQGSLYWQFNDVWPTVSWSGIDYWGNYKAMQYEVRDAYAPVIVDIIEREGNRYIALSSDLKDQAETVTVSAEVLTYTGKSKGRNTYTFDIKTTPIVLTQPLEIELPKGTFVKLTATDSKGVVIAERVYYPTLPKDMQLPTAMPNIQIQATKGEMTLTLSSPVLLMDLFIETPWQGAKYSDNFFDLLPGEAKTITIRHPDINRRNANDGWAIRIHTMNEILKKYRP